MSSSTEDLFYGWSKQSLEGGLDAMGCQGSSESTSSLLSGSITATLLNSELQQAQYKCLKSLESTKYQLFNDPIHGSIELHPLLAAIVKMRAFTRLKNVRQLGGVYYVYPGATHTRFEHSIGTCYIAGEFIQMLQRKQPELGITEKEALCVQIAALCHDLGHGPFSHLFEKDILREIGKPEGSNYSAFPKHEELSTLVFEFHVYFENKDLFDSYGIDHDHDVKFIKELIDHDLSTPEAAAELMRPERRFLYEIVANKCTGIDVDKWDYFARDCKYMGILTEFDWRRLMAVSRVIKVNGVHRICYREKEVNNIYGMFKTRASLFQKAYHHKSVIAAERMIVLAVCAVKDLPLIKPWTRVGPTTATSSSASAEAAEAKLQCISIMDAIKAVTNTECRKFEEYLALNDSIVHLILHCDGKDFKKQEREKLQKAQKLLDQLDKREMYRLIPNEDKKNISIDRIIACSNGKLEKDDIFQRTIKISYGSEKKGEQDDPVKDAYFYAKQEPWMAKKGDKIIVSDLVRPTKFALSEVWTYSSLSKYNEACQAFQKAIAELESGSLNTKAGEGATVSPQKRQHEQSHAGSEETPGREGPLSKAARKLY